MQEPSNFIEKQVWHSQDFDVKATEFSMPKDLFNMHAKFNFHDVELNKNQLKGRLDFIQEELNEAYKALEENDAAEFVDAHIDIMVVAQGTLDLGHVNTWKAWDEVLQANLTKEPGANNKRHDMEGMDLRKPEGWKAPYHYDNVGILPTIMQREESYKKARKDELNPEHRRYAIEFLEECKQIMLEKASDYNSEFSPVKTADYYPRGLFDLFHMIHIKYLRMKSLIHKMFQGGTVRNEDLRETLRDNAVFSAMMAEYVAGKMDGQKSEQGLFGEAK